VPLLRRSRRTASGAMLNSSEYSPSHRELRAIFAPEYHRASIVPASAFASSHRRDRWRREIENP